MNVSVLWIHVMECMCAQTRPRFMVERVLGSRVRTRTMLTSKGKIPSTRHSEQDWTQDSFINMTACLLFTFLSDWPGCSFNFHYVNILLQTSRYWLFLFLFHIFRTTRSADWQRAKTSGRVLKQQKWEKAFGQNKFHDKEACHLHHLRVQLILSRWLGTIV